MANVIQQKFGTLAPASDALAKGELAIRFVAANHTAASSSKLYFGEGDTPTLRQFGFGITDGSTQSGVAIGENLTFTGGNAISTSVSGNAVTINHDDTSSQASVNNSGSTFIQDITLDTYGHVTAITSASAGSGSGDITGVDLTGGTGITIGSETGTTSGDYSATISVTAGSIDTTQLADGGVTNAKLAGSIDLTSKVTGTLPVGNGGTGVTSMTNLKNALDDETWTFANHLTMANTKDLLCATEGGSNLGSTSTTWGSIYIADDEVIGFGDDQDVVIGNDTNTSSGRYANGLSIYNTTTDLDLFYYPNYTGVANADIWRQRFADGGTMTLSNFTSGSFVSKLTLDTSGNLTIPGELDAATLDISGNADIDGTLEADAITVNGTALNTVIAGVTVANATDATNAEHVKITNNASTGENNQIVFIENAAGGTANRGLEADSDFTYNPSTNTVTAGNFDGNLTIGNHTLNDVDIAGEFVDSDEHLMTAAAIDDRIAAVAGTGNFSFSGNTISNTNDILVDGNGDITLDANGGDIFFHDNTTKFGTIKNDSGGLDIHGGNQTTVKAIKTDSAGKFVTGHNYIFVVTAGVTNLGSSSAEKLISFNTTNGNTAASTPGNTYYNQTFTCPCDLDLVNVFGSFDKAICDGNLGREVEFRLTVADDGSQSFSDKIKVVEAVLVPGSDSTFISAGMNAAGRMFDFIADGGHTVTPTGAAGVQSFTKGQKISGGIKVNSNVNTSIRGSFTFVFRTTGGLEFA